MLRVPLSGKGQVSYGGQLLAGEAGQQCHRLLCYLLLHRSRPHHRERLRLLHVSLLAKLLAYHEGTGTYEQGLGYAGRILDCDPTREKVHRQAMRLHWLMGRPLEALA
jgi:DNA-binding SARP family transcriptional activator